MDTKEALRAARPAGKTGFVPTMGALHAGHRSLIDAAVAECDAVVVSIFVNPLQFAPTEDLATYPRTLDADLTICEQAGAAVVFTPTTATMYPDGDPQTYVRPGELSAILDGKSRPGHFDGVLTVVTKLFSLVRPDRAYFGEKDYQQLALIRRMSRDLDLGVEVVGKPTVREEDGLALSSRNVYLSAAERERALSLSRALRAGQEAGPGGPDAVLHAAAAELAEVDLDYLELRDVDLGPTPGRGSARLLVAARVGTTRLIDNAPVTLGDQ